MATAQVAGAVVVTAILTPILTGVFSKMAKRDNAKKGIIDPEDAPPAEPAEEKKPE